MDSKGNKEYVKSFEGAKIVDHTKDGRPIYEGPRGGHFYYSANGNKEYVKHDREESSTGSSTWSSITNLFK